MEKQDKTQKAIKILVDKYSELGRIPKRSDFDGKTICFIKQKLGPLPRALETAGLKEPNKISSKEKSKAKRERRKSAVKEQKRSEQNNI